MQYEADAAHLAKHDPALYADIVQALSQTTGKCNLVKLTNVTKRKEL